MLRDVMIRLITSAIGIVVSVSAFVILFIVYENNDIGFWSSLSGALAGICFYLHWKRGRETSEKWRTITTLFVMGYMSVLVGIGGVVGYLYLTFYYQIPIQPVCKSTAIAAIWSLICATWGIILMYYTNKYSMSIQEGRGPIFTET